MIGPWSFWRTESLPARISRAQGKEQSALHEQPALRTTASEVRKRIAQYYLEPGHESEIRIHLSLGLVRSDADSLDQRPAGSEKKDWATDSSLPYVKITQDYALISRVLDPTTDRMVAVAAGIASFGTMAAGEFLTNPVYFEAIAGQAPKNWERKNIQTVISTQVISANSGPPRVLATYFW